MKSLSTFVNESINSSILESFGSAGIGSTFKNLKGGLDRWAMSYFAWDKITDEDYEFVTPDEAKRMAYKRDSGDVFIWFEGSRWSEGNEFKENDRPVCFSIGTYMIQFFNHSVSGHYGTGRRGNKYSVKNLAENADKVILIKDPNRFITHELKRARREAKENALALKDCYTIAKENQERYKKLLAEKSLERDANTATIDARIKAITDEYTEFITDITSLETVQSDAIRDIIEANTQYSKILGYFKSVVYWSREGSTRDPVYAKKLLDATDQDANKLREIMTKARTKYL